MRQLCAFVAILPMWGVSVASGTPAPPCAACLAVALRPADAAPARRLGRLLDGSVLVFDAGAPDPATALELAAEGAGVWVALHGGQADELDLTGVAGVWVAPSTGVTAEAAVFEVRTAATLLRARAPGVVVGLVLDPRLTRPSVAAETAAYVDAVRAGSGGTSTAELARLFPGADLWRDVVANSPLDVEVADASRVVVHGAEPLRTLAEIAASDGLLVPGLTPLPDVQVACGGCRVSTFLHPDTLDAIAVIEASDEVATFEVRPTPSRATVIDLGTPGPAAPVALTGGAGRLPVPSRRFVLDLSGWRSAGEPFRDDVRVTAARRLSVAEILARHQAWRARQERLVRTSIASGATVITFDLPGFAGPVTVTARTQTFTRGGHVEMEQRDVRMNGVDMTLDGRAPRLPIIEPQRVMTPPLAISLGASYDYRLEGRGLASGHDCYVVSFRPAGGRVPSVEGRAWIETESFALVQIDAAQTGLRGPFLSSRQRDEFVAVPVGQLVAWLPGRTTVDQIYQAAGLRTPVHRVIALTEHEVNADDFAARREAAFASRAVILRDTPGGYQYLVPAPGAPGGRVPAPHAGRRVVSLAFGVIDDPNISVPLPYAGLSYLDFDLLGRGIQLSGFFGGTYGQAAWTVPGVFRRGWLLTGRAFGIAASYNDRAFRDGREQYDENILQRPARFETGLVVPLAPRLQVRVDYELDYTAFHASADTAPDFVVPADALVHGARLAVDAQRGAWSAIAWWNPAWRQGWRPWGRPDTTDYHTGSAHYVRYGLTLARAWIVSPASVARVEGSWMGGHDLDRFSRYTVEALDNPLRGYPSASLRYDRGGVVRSVATWGPSGGGVRLDGFADLAVVHDPGFGPGLRGYPGLGAAVEVPLPGRFLLSAEWGYGFNARNADGSRGTQVVRVAGIKVF